MDMNATPRYSWAQRGWCRAEKMARELSAGRDGLILLAADQTWRFFNVIGFLTNKYLVDYAGLSIDSSAEVESPQHLTWLPSWEAFLSGPGSGG